MEDKLISINLNDFVYVKLNDLGKEIYYHKDDELIQFYENRKDMKTCIIRRKFPELDDNGYLKIQLWEFMNIYGKYLSNGFNIPFESTELLIERIE